MLGYDRARQYQDRTECGLVAVHGAPGDWRIFRPVVRCAPPRHWKAEKCACPLTTEGDSPIFAAKHGLSVKEAPAAAKIGTVPREPLPAGGGRWEIDYAGVVARTARG